MSQQHQHEESTVEEVDFGQADLVAGDWRDDFRKVPVCTCGALFYTWLGEWVI